LAAELGMAVGLVNAYLNRCIRKGLVKVSQAPARRYVYYLTPQGFVEKSRLSLKYLTLSLSFFRQAKTDCLATFEAARGLGLAHIVLDGASELTEIATICARESGLEIVAVVDRSGNLSNFLGFAVVRTYEEITGAVDGVIVTDLQATREAMSAATAHFGADRVLVPGLLRKAIALGEGVP
jgi:hypothetical protein